jgi:hypothetical protein
MLGVEGLRGLIVDNEIRNLMAIRVSGYQVVGIRLLERIIAK